MITTRRPRRATAELAVAGVAAVVLLVAGGVHGLYAGHGALPDLGPFTRFEFPTIGYISDANGRPLLALARERRQITRYADLPPIVREAVVAAEDKRFFSHGGVDYLSLPRAVSKARIGAWVGRLFGGGPAGSAIFPQGASTITQQLVRGVFLTQQTAAENSHELRSPSTASRILAALIGARAANMAIRKHEEIRLSLWLERRMRDEFGSKRRAKEEILARYVSFVYMGRGQYGFARASEFYFGRPLSTFVAADADKAALLAGIPKAPRDYGLTARDTAPILRRRDQILTLMAARGFLSPAQLADALRQPFPDLATDLPSPFQSSAVVEHVLDELSAVHPGLGIEDLLQGRIQVQSTVDARVQHIVSEALEHGLAAYEQRRPRSAGLVQGSVVVLRNHDGRVLAETGGRQVYQGRATAYSDFNRVRRSLRQPGSTMKPLVYLAAFERGDFSLDTLVPDDPISVPDSTRGPKWISNYDGIFRGRIPIREALAESRNAAAVWLARRIGIDAVLHASVRLGVRTPLHPYPTTALGASEVSLLELATAYRSIASGIYSPAYVVQQIVRDSGDVLPGGRQAPVPVTIHPDALALVQEGLRGVVRLPSGTAHRLAARAFPIAVMGKTGTTDDFRDALFVGSTYGPEGITVAVRIGFDDNRSLGSGETGGRVALPVFQEVMQRIYGDAILGPAPSFPRQMEQRITRYLSSPAPLLALELGPPGEP